MRLKGPVTLLYFFFFLLPSLQKKLLWKGSTVVLALQIRNHSLDPLS